MSTKTDITFLKYGLSTDIIKRLLNEKLSVTTIRKLSNANLVEKFNLKLEEVKYIKQHIVRKPIEKNTLNSLLINNNFTCCCCLGEKGQSYIVHHIEEYEISQDNSYNNLAVLCPVCHDLAHRRGSLTLGMTKDQLYLAKKTWEAASIKKRSATELIYPVLESRNCLFAHDYYDGELKYMIGLTIEKVHNNIKGEFYIVYLERGNTFMAGEFTHSTERKDVDIEISYWEMHLGIRSTPIRKTNIILNYISDDKLIWTNLNEDIEVLPKILELT